MRFVPFLALLALASPSYAQDTGGTPNKEEKKICRSTATTGSILGGKRECRTKAEWDEIAERDRAQRDRLDRGERTRNGGLGINRD